MSSRILKMAKGIAFGKGKKVKIPMRRMCFTEDSLKGFGMETRGTCIVLKADWLWG